MQCTMMDAIEPARTEHPSPAVVRRGPKPRAIVIGRLDGDLAELLAILIDAGWAVSWWNNFADAAAALQEETFNVALCDREFPGGTWRAVVAFAGSLEAPPPVILTSRTAGELLWLQALEAGVYDVLPKPYDAREVLRVVGEACRRPQDAPARAARPGRQVA